MTETKKRHCAPDKTLDLLTEIRDLKNSVAALRDALEQASIDREKSIRQATAASSAELVQLRATVIALREALEQGRIDRDKAVQSVLRTAHDEIEQLKSTISILRGSLDSTRANA